MSIDAVALLRIRRLEAPRTSVGTTFLVQHRRDCSLLHTMARFEGTPLDEHVLRVRRLLGDALDRHHDERGVYVFPDVCEPRGDTYEAILEELGGAGGFGPMVSAAHVPRRRGEAAEGSYEALERRARQRLGDDAEAALLLTEMSFLLARADPSRQAEYRENRDRLLETMGAAFVTELERHLERKSAAAFMRPRGVELRAEALLDATEAAPVVTPQALDRFFDSGEAARAVEALGPAFKAHVAHALTSLGVDPAALPEDDLARRLAKAAGLERAEKAPRRRPTRRRKRPAKR